jgi:inorganic pyrophosphatase
MFSATVCLATIASYGLLEDSRGDDGDPLTVRVD